MSAPFRLPTGGRVQRAEPLRFSFDGVEYRGLRGDTRASALLACGVRPAPRSTPPRRPRGIFTAGVEEPNALVQLERPWSEPMLSATTLELFDGLCARGLPGRGVLESGAEEAFYDRINAHCDVLVVGGGPAGLAAALAAGRAGARLILADEQNELGGSLLGTRERLDGAPAEDRPPWRGRPRTSLPPARLACPGAQRGARHGSARATDRLRRQRPAGDHARPRGSHLRQPLRGGARS